jgi:hypothetical protein
MGLYESFQSSLPLKAAQTNLDELVRFNGNKNDPVHRWFAFKEGFSSNLLNWVCNNCSVELDAQESILDPFCGVGTSLLSAQMSFSGNGRLTLVGIEYNPFIQSVAQSKLLWPKYRPSRIEELIPKLLSPLETKTLNKYELPTLSTIKNPDVFKPKVVKQLMAYRNRIVTELSSKPEKFFFLLGWAAIIEQVSGLRKDGRALRFKQNNNSHPVKALLKKQWELMLSDLYLLKKTGSNTANIDWKIARGDGRTLSSLGSSQNEFDLIIYSPPYLNNIDYSEVYKLELWLSGMVSTMEEFKRLRLGTLRSHPSIKFPETHITDELQESSWVRRLRNALISALPMDMYYTQRRRTIRGYIDDMFQSLSSQVNVAHQDTTIVCVVGNSLHGKKEHPIPIAIDLLICALALEIGLKVERLQVARQLNRRDNNNQMLRESIIIMKK